MHEEHKVWNLFAIEAALDAGGNVAAGEDLPDGIPASDLLIRNSNVVTLKVQRAFGEGKPAAYVTSEIWVDYYDAVWTQPLYAQLIDAATELSGAPRIIDVGPESSFYSPFWHISGAVVGNVAADSYHSTKELLDNASQFVPLGMKTCPLRPMDVGSSLALPAPWDTWGITLQMIPAGSAVFDEEGSTETVGLFDFGHELFELETTTYGAIVEPMPMYLFVRSDGTPLTNEPRVLSAGEVAHDAAGAPRPRFGAYWHVIEAKLPASAEAFHGSEHPAARDAAARAGGDPLEYEGRVALNAVGNAGCFDDAAANDFPAGCIWLDSADKVESMLSLHPTDLTQTGPIVLWDKAAVPEND